MDRSSIDVARRAFLSGRRAPAALALRPPWALAESEFVERCTRCDECVARCPEGVLRRGEGGFPVAVFAFSACTFCGECLDACAPGALRNEADAPPWNARARIGEACLAERQIACQLCRDACEPRAIRFRYLAPVPTPQIEAATCAGCGACVSACPARAINVSRAAA
jgi:ferredoxin-type protein NapF